MSNISSLPFTYSNCNSPKTEFFEFAVVCFIIASMVLILGGKTIQNILPKSIYNTYFQLEKDPSYLEDRFEQEEDYFPNDDDLTLIEIEL